MLLSVETQVSDWCVSFNAHCLSVKVVSEFSLLFVCSVDKSLIQTVSHMHRFSGASVTCSKPTFQSESFVVTAVHTVGNAFGRNSQSIL